MKNLLEISTIVTKKKVKKIEIFDEASLKVKNSKFNEFYEALLSGKFKNDRDAASQLYGCSPTDDKYRQLKSRFRKRLLNTLFFLDINLPNTSNYDRAYYSCNKDWTLVKILLSNGASFTAATIARQILGIALKFRFADLIVNCSRILRNYAAETDSEKEFEEYDQFIKQYADILDAEIRSEELYQRVTMNYYLPFSKTSDLREKIDTYCDALVGLSEVYDSPVIIYNMYLVWAFRFEMLRDYEAIIEICSKAENYIEENPLYYQDGKLATFYLKKMSAFLHMKDYKRGKINAEKCLQSFEEGSDNWYDFIEYYFLLSMHTDNHINALAILTKATSHARFKKVNATIKEKWKIYEAYLGYIVEIYGNDNPVLRQQGKKVLRVNRLLNDPVIYPKDQRIFTIMMVIVQLLLFIEKKNFPYATELLERLKIYANRQLKKDEFYRTIQFIRLLQQLSKADFDPDQLTSNDKYYQRLLQNPFFYRGLINELEIIPYEKLWGIIIERLK